jgi:RNA polymerase sigma factor (sigma-70 family)
MQDGQSTDEQLLEAHVARHDEAAFAELVRRHVNLVYGTALRILGDPPTAEEVTQNVFITLARKASSIGTGSGLAGWLHRAAILETRLRQRTDLRRRNREEHAAQLGTAMDTPSSTDPRPFEILDDALLELPEKDRQTLLLRYFENRPFREIAQRLGVGEDAAQKRSARALETLATILRRRGAATVTASLAARTLEAAALTTAPVPLATSITTAAIAAAGVAVSSSALAILVSQLMAYIKTQTAVACLLIAAVPVGYQWHSASTLRRAAAEIARNLAATTQALTRAEADEAGNQRRLKALSERLAETRSLLRRASDQVATAASVPDASLYLWSDTASHVRIPKSIAPRLRLSGSVPVPTSPGDAPHRAPIPAVSAEGSLAEPLAEALGVTEAEANAIRQAFAQTVKVLQEQVHAAAYVTNWAPAQVRSDSKPAATLITPALPDRGIGIHDQLRQSLDGILGVERADLVWKQSELTFENELNRFGGIERIQTVIRSGPKELLLCNGIRTPDGGIQIHSVSSGELSLKTLPVRLQSVVAGWLTNSSEPQRP